MAEITAYMASNECGSITAVQRDTDGVDVSGGEITALIVRNEIGVITAGELSCQMIKIEKDPYEDGGIQIDAIIIEVNPADPNQYKITVNNPNKNIDKWLATRIMAYEKPTASPRQFGTTRTRTSGRGAIPENNADIITPDSPFYETLSNNSIIPGELVAPQWDFLDGNNILHQTKNLTSGKYFKTDFLSGGIITSFYSTYEYEDFDLRFVVSTEGATKICRPSDFTRWEVGDYVFLAFVNDEFVILPIQINGRGA